MRRSISLAIVAACGGAGDPGPPPPTGLDRAPRLDVALPFAAKLAPVPPPLVLIDADGHLHLGAAGTWGQLATSDPMASAKRAHAEYLWPLLVQARARQLLPSEVLAAYRDVAPPREPPPATVDDGSDESGGTGTAVTLDESKAMLAHAFPEAEQERLEKLHRRGSPGRLAAATPSDETEPARLATIAGTSEEDATVLAPYVLVLAAPEAKATALVGALTEVPGLVAVVHGGAVRALRLSFFDPDDEAAHVARWVEVRVTAKDLIIEAPPDLPRTLSWASGPLDPKALRTSLDAARASRKRSPESPVDVLVDPGVSSQRLVDVLAALDLAGARSIGLGPAPSAAEAQKRGKREPRLVLMFPLAQGDLAKAEITKVVVAHRPELFACYQAALATKPGLEGVMETQFFITPLGVVEPSSVTAAGVDTTVAACIAKSIKGLAFPKPRGGGGVQVNYPLLMSP